MENWQKLLVLVAVVLGLLFLFGWWNGSVVVPNQGELTLPRGATEDEEPVGDEQYVDSRAGAPMNAVGANVAGPVGQTATGSSEGFCGGKDQLNPQDLLPQDYASTWAKVNPGGTGTLAGQNFLDASSHIGINTVGQTLRNPNLQLRSEPPNPQVVVSPFLQSSIMPDTQRRYFEVGSC